MNTVILHPARFQIDFFHEKGNQRNIEFLRKLRINRAKRLIIPASIVGRQTNLHQKRLCIGRFHGRNDFTQRGFYGVRLKAAQAVVAAQFNQHPARLVLLQKRREARQPLL